MKSVKIDVITLKAKVAENKEKHVATYNEALKGFKVEQLSNLKKAVKSAKADKEIDLSFLYDQKPQSHEKEYNRALAMLDATVDDVVELSATEFSQYFMDEWAWKQDFLSNSMKYSKSSL